MYVDQLLSYYFFSTVQFHYESFNHFRHQNLSDSCSEGYYRTENIKIF